MASIVNGPSPLDWKVYAGDRNLVSFSFTAGTEPWVLTGAQLAAQARVSSVDENVALTATIIETDPANGQYDIAWDGDAVAVLLAGADSWKGVWDLQVLESGELLPVTLLRGKFTAVLDITRQLAG